MLHRAARNAYSWWWASHIRTKQSKWLDQNLQDMEEKVEYALKIIDEDGDSFARRAEMYYKRRPELLNFVEDFFRSYRALAERFDHLSKDLQTANRTIATVYPERVQLSMEDEDGEHFLAALGPPKESNEPSKSVPAAPKLCVPKRVPSFAKRNPKPSRLMSKKGLMKFNVDDATTAACPSSGLKKSEALQEIDRLQKEILALQTEKEFIQSSYENGLARYWQIEEHVTEMQAKVSNLQDEFGIGTMIEDDEARTLMTATALNSCQETLARLQDKQKQSVEDVIAEHQKILEVLGKFETLKGKFVSHLPHPQVLSEVNKSVNPDAELKKLNRQVETSEREKHNPEVHSKVKELLANSATSLTMSDLAEKVDELVDKVIYLETALASQNAYVNRLRSETNELHSHLTKAAEEKGTLVEDSQSMSKRIRELEDDLLRVQNLNESIKFKDNHCQSRLTEASGSSHGLSEKLLNKRQDEDVKDTSPSNKEIGVAGVDKAKQFQAHEAIILAENVLGISKGLSSKEGPKKEVLQKQAVCLEVDQQKLVESHSSNNTRNGQTGGTLEANQGVSGVDKAKQFQVHEAISPGENVLGISKCVSSKVGLKKEVSQEQEGCLEVDQPNVVKNHFNNDTQGEQTGGTLEASQGSGFPNKVTMMMTTTTPHLVASEGVHQRGNITKSGPVEEAANVLIEKGSAKLQHRHLTDHSSATGNFSGEVEGRGTNDIANRNDDCSASAPANQIKDSTESECVRSPGDDEMISSEIRIREEAKKQDTWDNLLPFKGKAEKLSISDLQNDHDDLTKVGPLKDAEDVEIEKGFDISQHVHAADHGSATRKNVRKIEQKGTNDLAERRDDFTNSVKDTEEKLYKSNYQNPLNDFSQDVNMKRGFDESESFRISNDDLVTKRYAKGEEQASTKDAAEKSDYLHISIEGKEEKLYKTHHQNFITDFSQNSLLRDSPKVQIEMRFDESDLHVSDNESVIRRDMRMEERTVNKAIAEQTDRLHIPKEGKEEKSQNSNHPNNQYDLPISDVANIKMEKAFHEREPIQISDDFSDTRKERMEELIVRDAPDAEMEESNKILSTSTSRDSALSKNDRVEQQESRVDIEDRFASSTSEEGKSSSNQGSYFNDLLQVSPSGATLDDTSGRGSKEYVHKLNPPRRDSTFFEDMEIQIKKLEYDPFNSQKHHDNNQVKCQGSTIQKSTSEKSDQGEDTQASISGSGISMTMKKAFHESESVYNSDDFSAIREERKDELAVRDAPHAEMEESNQSRSTNSSHDSAISKNVRVEQQASRIDIADEFASSTGKEGQSSSNQGSYFNDPVQVSPSGATLDDTSGRGSKEDTPKYNPRRHDSTFFEDTEIQIKKLDSDLSDSQNQHDNVQVKGQASILQKSTPEKSVQDEDARASISDSGISMALNNKGREEVGDNHDFTVAVGSAAENFSKSNDSKHLEDLSRKIKFKNKIEPEEQNNEFFHKFIQVETDGDFQQSNWHNQLEKHSPQVHVRDIKSTCTANDLEEWGSILDNLPSVLRDNKREDLNRDELPDQGNDEDSRRQMFRTVHNGLYMEQDESGIEDDQPNWRELFINSLDDREKILLEEYTSVLRNFKGVKKKLNDAEKKRRASHFQYVVQMKVLKNANALKDAQILSLQHRLNSLQSKDIETTNFNEMQKEATLQAAGIHSQHHEEGILLEFSDKSLAHSTDIRQEATAPEEIRISDIGEDDGDIKVTGVDETPTFATVEEKVRMDIDDLLEENIELWLRFSTSFYQLQKFQTTVQDLQAEINKVKEESKQDTSQPHSLLSGIRPIYRHLREIQTELTLWLDHNAVLKDDLQNRLSSLSNILDVITRLSKSGSKESDPVLNAYQAAKFQGEILNMKQENNKLAGELEVGFECIRKLQDEIRSTLSNLDEELGLKNQQTRPRSRIPLRSFLFGVKLKKQRPSIFSCMNPALQKQYSDLTSVPR